jgi:antirestriction protein ArdC
VSFAAGVAVFNADQIEGLPERFHLPRRFLSCRQADALPSRAQTFVERLPATVHIRGDRAFYDPTADSITMPPPEQFSTRLLGIDLGP